MKGVSGRGCTTPSSRTNATTVSSLALLNLPTEKDQQEQSSPSRGPGRSRSNRWRRRLVSVAFGRADSCLARAFQQQAGPPCRFAILLLRAAYHQSPETYHTHVKFDLSASGSSSAAEANPHRHFNPHIQLHTIITRAVFKLELQRGRKTCHASCLQIADRHCLTMCAILELILDSMLS